MKPGHSKTGSGTGLYLGQTGRSAEERAGCGGGAEGRQSAVAVLWSQLLWSCPTGRRRSGPDPSQPDRPVGVGSCAPISAAPALFPPSHSQARPPTKEDADSERQSGSGRANEWLFAEQRRTHRCSPSSSLVVFFRPNSRTAAGVDESSSGVVRSSEEHFVWGAFRVYDSVARFCVPSATVYLVVARVLVVLVFV
ncbi:unnamed protein product [Calypogeia fissa]